MQQGVRHLREGIVDLVADARLVVGCQTPMANVSYDSSDLHRISAQSGNPKTFANWIVFAESVPRQVFVDYDNQLTADAVIFVKEATGAQRNAHHGQEIGRYAGGQRERGLIRWRRCGGRRVTKGILAFAHGNDVGKSGGCDARSALGAIEDVLPSRTNLRRIPKRGRRKRET